MAITINGTTGISGVNGSETTPAIQGDNDTNTGISFDTDEVNIVTGGTTRATVDSSGRLLVGTTSITGDQNDGELVLQGSTTQGELYLSRDSTPGNTGSGLGFINFTGGNGTDSAGIKAFSDGGTWTNGSSHPSRLEFSTTADGDPSPTTQMTIDSAGYLGIGTVSPEYKLHLEHDGTVALQLEDTSTSTRFRIQNANSTLKFTETGVGDRVVIDSSGRLLVGDISYTTTASTIEALKPGGGSNIIRVQSGTQGSNELANGQEVAFSAQGFANSNGRQAKIGVYKHSGITNAVGYIFLDEQDGGNAYLWTDNSGKFRISTSASHLGTTSGTVVGTQTSDERLKNVGENVAYGLNEVLQLQPKQYALKTEPDTNKLGFIAQEVLPIIPEAVFDTNEELEGHQEGDSTKLGMEYVQLIPVLVNAIKEQQTMIETLETVNAEQATTIASFEARISALEGGN